MKKLITVTLKGVQYYYNVDLEMWKDKKEEGTTFRLKENFDRYFEYCQTLHKEAMAIDV